MIPEANSNTATEADPLTTQGSDETQLREAGHERPEASAKAGTPGGQEPVKKADFQPLSETPSRDSRAGLDVLYDVNLSVSVELGRTWMTVGEMLAVCQGSVIRLDRATGEPVDVLVSGKVIGKGEVVVVDDKFGVRMTELLNRADGADEP